MLLKYYHFNYLIQSFLDHAKGGGGGGGVTQQKTKPSLAFSRVGTGFFGFFGVF